MEIHSPVRRLEAETRLWAELIPSEAFPAHSCLLSMSSHSCLSVYLFSELFLGGYQLDWTREPHFTLITTVLGVKA